MYESVGSLVVAPDGTRTVVWAKQPPQAVPLPPGAALSEAECLRILRPQVAQWKEMKWGLAADILQYFLNHKNGNPEDVLDVSKYAAAVNSSSTVTDALDEYFTKKAFALASARTNLERICAVVHPHFSPLVPGDRASQGFYAFGGFELGYESGTLTVAHTTLFVSWKFEGKLRIDDTYTFPDETYSLGPFKEQRAGLRRV